MLKRLHTLQLLRNVQFGGELLLQLFEYIGVLIELNTNFVMTSRTSLFKYNIRFNPICSDFPKN